MICDSDVVAEGVKVTTVTETIRVNNQEGAESRVVIPLVVRHAIATITTCFGLPTPCTPLVPSLHLSPILLVCLNLHLDEWFHDLYDPWGGTWECRHYSENPFTR